MSYSCPPPLVPAINAQKSSLCVAGCCVPCPLDDILFPSLNVLRIHQGLAGLNMLSFVLVVIVLLGHRVLREAPVTGNKWTTGLGIFLLMVQGTSIHLIYELPDATVCFNEITSSRGLHSGEANPRCLAQGTISIFASLGATIWSAMRLINLHAQIVHSFVLTPRMEIYIALGLGVLIPGTFALFGLLNDMIVYDGTWKCGPSIKNPGILWYPLLVLSTPSLLFHFWTTVEICRIKWRLNNYLRSQQSIGLSGSYRDSTDTVTPSVVNYTRPLTPLIPKKILGFIARAFGSLGGKKLKFGAAGANWSEEENGDISGSTFRDRVQFALWTVSVNWRGAACACGTMILGYSAAINTLITIGYQTKGHEAVGVAFGEWMTCLFTNAPNGHRTDQCIEIANRVSPDKWRLYLMEGSTSSLGLIYFLIENSRRSVWVAWWSFFVSLYRKLRRSSRSTENSNNSPELQS